MSLMQLLATHAAPVAAGPSPYRAELLREQVTHTPLWGSRILRRVFLGI